MPPISMNPGSPEFRAEVEAIVRRALGEDLPDITSGAIFEPHDRGRARFLTKATGVVAGLPFAAATFAAIDPSSEFRALSAEGSVVEAGVVIAEVASTVVGLLSGERTALNLLQRACGIATMTRRYVDAVVGTKARIHDTRKTAPGLRLLDKYAVVCGGGSNHRYGLHDMFLVKNNHVDRAGSLTAAVKKIRSSGLSQPLMVEVRNAAELEDALPLRPDFILLDNHTIDETRAAVVRVAGAIPLEASGGITLDNVRAVAETGVDRISIGALTHSVWAMDISLRIDVGN